MAISRATEIRRLPLFSQLRLRLDEGVRNAVSGHPDFSAVSRPRLLVRIGLAVIGMVAVWAYFSAIDRTVRADARVVPAGRAQVIQHLEGGIVSGIVVREGALVKKGDLLMTLSNTQADSVLSERQGKLAALRVRAARLKSEATGSERVNFPEDMEKSKEADTERELFLVRRQKMLVAVEGAMDQLRQREAGLKELQSRRQSIGSEIAIAKQQLQIITGLISKNAASQLELLDARSRVSKLETQIVDIDSAIPKTRSAIQEAQNKAHELSLQYRSEATSELITTENEVAKIEQEIRAESDRVDRTEIRSPVAGIVNRLYLNTVGGVVKSGEPVLELTPVDDRRILLEGGVRPADRAELRPGLRANVRIAAYDYGIFGILNGTVTEISADTVPDERGMRYYRIQVEVTNLPESYRDKLIAPGMTAMADVVTGHRTVFQYLVSPLSKFAYSAFREPR